MVWIIGAEIPGLPWMMAAPTRCGRSLSGFTTTALNNLEKLISAKSWILKKMTGADELPAERRDDCLRFAWFKPDSSVKEIDAYALLITRLCETAKAKQRITADERKLNPGENEKYKAGCTLLALGFIGPKYPQARKIMLSPLSGNGSFNRGGQKKEK